jgi:hypothetical protein
VSGFPFIDYKAVVEIEPSATGSTITWSCAFYPKYAGWFWSFLMRRTLTTMVAKLAAAALAAEAAPALAA